MSVPFLYPLYLISTNTFRISQVVIVCIQCRGKCNHVAGSRGPLRDVDRKLETGVLEIGVSGHAAEGSAKQWRRPSVPVGDGLAHLQGQILPCVIIGVGVTSLDYVVHSVHEHTLTLVVEVVHEVLIIHNEVGELENHLKLQHLMYHLI